jgi:flagellar motor switch protein FliN/FliY
MSENQHFESYEAASRAGGTAAGEDGDLRRLRDVLVELTVEIGRTRMSVGETLELRPGSVVALNRMAGEPVDLLVNGRRIARGEVVVVDEEFGLRITEIGLSDGDGEVETAPAGEAPFDERGLDEAIASGELLEGEGERAA